jgi:hypothetical protein
MRFIQPINHYSRLIARPLLVAAGGAGAARLLGRWVPLAASTPAMVASAVVTATVTELALWALSDAPESDITVAQAINELNRRYKAADEHGKREIEADIRSVMGDAMADVIIEEREAATA